MRREIEEQPAISARLVERLLPLLPSIAGELRARGSVMLCGTGASLNACQAARYAFLSCGSLLPYVVAAADLPYLAPRIPPDAQLILVSQSGNSHETAAAARLLRSSGTPFWAVTNDPRSVLGRLSSRVFELQAGEEVSSATKTYTASLVVLYLLAAAGDDRALAEIAGIPRAIAETIRDAESPVVRLGEELRSARSLFVAGIGALAAVAPQAALLLKEKVLIPAEGMPISELRHGSVEVIRPGFPVIVVAAGERGRGEAAGHVDYLSSIGARVWSVTDAALLPVDPPSGVIPIAGGIRESLSHAHAAVPFQLLAEGMARSAGYAVDGFRFLSKVIESYDTPAETRPSR